MIVGSTIPYPGNTSKYYSPAFPRGGQAATFSLDVTHLTASPTLVVTIEHKNADDTTWATAATFTSITAVGVATKDATSLKEQIRIAFNYTAGSAGDFVHVVVAAPAWRTYD
ncbi:MAG: hypothetical protein ACYTGN_01820 [Planctomycetota bacterium]|jgi:hypothetical protein